MNPGMRPPVEQALESTREAFTGQRLTRLEKANAKISPGMFLGAGLSCCALATALMAGKKEHWSLLVGSWVPTILLMGLYSAQTRKQI